MEMRTHYSTLGVPETASQAEINAAYRIKSEMFSGSTDEDERRLRGLRQAYAVLSDPAKRQQYDDVLERMRPGERRAEKVIEPEAEPEPYIPFPTYALRDDPSDVGPEYDWRPPPPPVAPAPAPAAYQRQPPATPQWEDPTAPALPSLQEQKARTLAWGKAWRFFEILNPILFLGSYAVEYAANKGYGYFGRPGTVVPYVAVVAPLLLSIFATYVRVSALRNDYLNRSAAEIDQMYASPKMDPARQLKHDAVSSILVLAVLIGWYINNRL